MSATQAPTPGPLSAEGVKLLRKGDLLLALETTCNFFAGEVLTFEGPGPLSECMVNGMSWMASRFAFIGRPGADGWMPWSGGENPVPGRVVEIELRGLGLIGPDLSDHFDWRHEADNEDQDVIAFRLAPAAPVEASGSELHPATADLVDRFAAELKSKLAKAEAKYGYAADWLNTDWQDELNESLAEHIQKGDPRDVAAYCAFAWHHGWSTSDALGHFAPKLHFQSSRERIAKCIRRAVGDAWIGECQAEVAADAVLNLRPQPSGETREAVRLRGDIISIIEDARESAVPEPWEVVSHAADRILALLSARPLALGSQQGVGLSVLQEAIAHMSWMRKFVPCVFDVTEERLEEIDTFISENEDSTPARAEAQDEGALSILDCLLDHSGARGSFDAMRHGDAVKDAEELLRSARSPGHTDLMVTPESIDAYMKDNPMEAKNEGAAGEIKSCPFCGGEAEIIHLDDGDNAGGSCVCCTKCQASGNVEFGRKENFVENWNRRSHPSPPPAADEDRVREACEIARDALKCEGPEHELIYQRDRSALDRIATGPNLQRAIAAALKSEGK